MGSVRYQSASVITAILRATTACNHSDGEYVRVDTISNDYYSRGRNHLSTGFRITNNNLDSMSGDGQTKEP